MQKIINKIIVIIFFLNTACASNGEDVKKGLGGQKKTGTDEFLVKKNDYFFSNPIARSSHTMNECRLIDKKNINGDAKE